MRKAWRRLALVAALNVTLGVGAAAAQSVIVRSAPPGSSVELVLNGATIGSATAARDGNATLPVNLSTHLKKPETDAHVYVDVCGDTMRRVLLAEPGVLPAPPNAGCDRTEMVGLFVVRGVTTLVVDLAGARPAVWLRQGPAPAEWLSEDRAEESVQRARRPAPKGLVVFGGAGLARFSNATSVACGNATSCEGKDRRTDYTVGAAVWVTRFLAVQGSYLRPGKLTVSGSGTGYRFDNLLDAHILTVAANLGVPIGPVRIYGQVGGNFHRATSSMTETIDDVTATVDGVVQTIPGGTVALEMKTQGWGWLYGGGLEGWVKPSFALYAEAGQARLKGAERNNGAGTIDDRVNYVLAGLRVRIGG